MESHLARPAGPRFGTLVHAALATVALDATAAQVVDGVSLQARILGAPAEEVEAATSLVAEALGHPLMLRARDAWGAGGCRRETPVKPPWQLRPSSVTSAGY